MRKIARIITELQPHQKRALQRALLHNLLLAHSTGSGKTLTSIAIADALGKPVTVLPPAPLVENFKKELAKHKVDGPPVEVISMPTAVRRNYQIPEGNTVIIDEAHALRNAATARQQYIKDQVDRAGRIIALTGTPAYNKVEDWAPLVNIVAKKPVIPEDSSAFRQRFIKEVKKNPGLLDRWLHNVKPGVTYELQHTDELKKAVAPYIDIFDADVEKPERVDETVTVPMSSAQEKAYALVQKKLPLNIIYKLFSNIPPSKSEAKSLNSFLTGVRQVSNTPEEYTTKDVEPGNKIKRVVEDILKERAQDPNYKAFVYSNFIGSGIKSLGKQLDKEKVPYASFTGATSPAQRKEIVDAYNTGKLPIILGSGSASEGLDLKGTKAIKLLEPHFNNSRLAQVIGRGIRYKSHDALPPEERKVKVTRYLSALSPSSSFFGLFKKPRTSVDEYLTSRSEEKDALANAMKDALTTEE